MRYESKITLIETGEDIRLDTALRCDDAISLVRKYLKDESLACVKAMLIQDLSLIKDRVLGDMVSDYRHS